VCVSLLLDIIDCVIQYEKIGTRYIYSITIGCVFAVLSKQAGRGREGNLGRITTPYDLFVLFLCLIVPTDLATSIQNSWYIVNFVISVARVARHTNRCQTIYTHKIIDTLLRIVLQAKPRHIHAPILKVHVLAEWAQTHQVVATDGKCYSCQNTQQATLSTTRSIETDKFTRGSAV
jgi:hypothetical protein